MPRQPRFNRSSAIRSIEVTQRDRQVLRIVHRHRFLNTRQICQLLGGSAAPLSRRLQLLYHHGYLDRPRCQLDYFYRDGSRPFVYCLTNKGARRLRNDGININSHRFSDKNRSVCRPYLEHVLFVAEVMIAVEVACLRIGAQLISSHELNGGAGFHWRVSVDKQIKIGPLPDAAFAIESQRGINAERAYFFLEADRGTMPVRRNTLSLSSIYRKLLAYQATWQQGLHHTLFGMHRFRVLIVTKSIERCQAMIECCSQLGHGQGLFLFGDKSTLQHPAGILSAPWRTAKGEITSLLG